MRNTLKQKVSQKFSNGFTLIEVAISIMILGLLLVPAAGVYSLYQKDLEKKCPILLLWVLNRSYDFKCY